MPRRIRASRYRLTSKETRLLPSAIVVLRKIGSSEPAVDALVLPKLRYAFPLWLRVSAENPFGLGEMSQDFKYSIETQIDCMRISGEYMLTYIGSKVFSTVSLMPI